MKHKKSRPNGLLPLTTNHTKSKALQRALFGSKNAKPLPASLTAQRAWQGFSAGLKKELRKSLPDLDRDGVPNGFDCKPRNPRRQDSFLPIDSVFLSSNPEIKLGKKISGGQCGDVYEVLGNRNLVVKVPRHISRTSNASSRGAYGGDAIQEEEVEFCQRNNLENEPLIIPTKVVSVNNGNPDNPRKYPGLVRPKITPIVDRTKPVNPGYGRRLTDSQLLDLRKTVIDLSNKGYTFWDGLQIGIDVRGRLLVYDLGLMEKSRPSDREITFNENDEAWERFLLAIGKTHSDYLRYGGELK